MTEAAAQTGATKMDRNKARLPGYLLGVWWKVVLVFVLLILTGCKETAYRDLSQIEVNNMLSVLLESGIESEKVRMDSGQYQLNVESDQLGRAIRILREQGYPRENFADVGEIFKKEGLLSSPLEERVRYIYAMSERISETLSHIDGVITARVNLVVPENNPFAKGTKPSSASVFIKHNPDVDLESLKSDIKLFVEKSVEGLQYEKVTVVTMPAQRVTPAPSVNADTSASASVGGGWMGVLIVLLVGGIGWVGWNLFKAPAGSHGDAQAPGDDGKAASHQGVIEGQVAGWTQERR